MSIDESVFLFQANFGTMFGAIREAAFGSRDSETTTETHSNPLTYFAMGLLLNFEQENQIKRAEIKNFSRKGIASQSAENISW